MLAVGQSVLTALTGRVDSRKDLDLDNGSDKKGGECCSVGHLLMIFERNL
jgi:hypothetical protein